MNATASTRRDDSAEAGETAVSRVSTVLRWLAEFGLSLGAVDYALPEARESACPFAALFKPVAKPIR